MTATLRDYQQQAEAIFSTAADQTIVDSFGNDAAAFTAATTTVALIDRSHWGRLHISDHDRLSFLHNQTTSDFKSLQPGQGCEAVVVNSTARTLDLVTAYVTDEAVILLTSPNSRKQLIPWFDRYIFFGDKVQLTDHTESTLCFSLIGPESEALLQSLGITQLPSQPHHHTRCPFADGTIRIASGSGLTTPGYTLIFDISLGTSLWAALTEAGAVPCGDRVWEQLRILQGRPMPDAELTEDYNPLEAGLWHTVSFNKGCYIGQETIARLNTYNGVKQQLWGIRLEQRVPIGSPILLGEQKVGILTSLAETPLGIYGLGYIKTKAGGEGLTVQIAEASGEVTKVPYLTRSPAIVAVP
jgi:tRNA-modifying protein YgfZ